MADRIDLAQNAIFNKWRVEFGKNLDILKNELLSLQCFWMPSRSILTNCNYIAAVANRIFLLTEKTCEELAKGEQPAPTESYSSPWTSLPGLRGWSIYDARHDIDYNSVFYVCMRKGSLSFSYSGPDDNKFWPTVAKMAKEKEEKAK